MDIIISLDNKLLSVEDINYKLCQSGNDLILKFEDEYKVKEVRSDEELDTKFIELGR